MLINLREDFDEIKEQNIFIENWKKEEPFDEYVKNLKPIGALEDIFIPYKAWNKDIVERYETFDGIYISFDSNPDGYLERLVIPKREDYKNSKFRFRSFGLCDNASQAKDYFDSLMEEGIINESDNFIITLTPMSKDDDTFSNVRWKKQGRYIGEKEHFHEYIFEDDISLIFLFQIHKMSEI